MENAGKTGRNAVKTAPGAMELTLPAQEVELAPDKASGKVIPLDREVGKGRDVLEAVAAKAAEGVDS